MDFDPFAEYIRHTEPDAKSKAITWSIAVGLQKTDGLTPSAYLLELAQRNIQGEITLAETEQLITGYYKQNPPIDPADRTQEADTVAARIAILISEPAFTLSVHEYLLTHRSLFTGLYEHAGRIRSFNLTKKEWVLDGDTVIYGNAPILREALEHDIREEKAFNYQGLSQQEIAAHLSKFTSLLWQNHVFEEGNTRTTAVFLIKYLRTLGYDVDNELFAQNSIYFRNALVRANYKNLQTGISETTEYLENFFHTLLFGADAIGQNRKMHIYYEQKIKPLEEALKVDIERRKVDIDSEKLDIEPEKLDIEPEKLDVEPEKLDIEPQKLDIDADTTAKTEHHIKNLRESFGKEIFGRTQIVEITQLSNAGASNLIKRMLEIGVIEPVSGHGKGKYVFKSL